MEPRAWQGLLPCSPCPACHLSCKAGLHLLGLDSPGSYGSRILSCPSSFLSLGLCGLLLWSIGVCCSRNGVEQPPQAVRGPWALTVLLFLVAAKVLQKSGFCGEEIQSRLSISCTQMYKKFGGQCCWLSLLPLCVFNAY